MGAPTKEQVKVLEERAKKAGVICCKLCNKPSGIYKLTLKKIEGGYACNYCRPDLFVRS